MKMAAAFVDSASVQVQGVLEAGRSWTLLPLPPFLSSPEGGGPEARTACSLLLLRPWVPHGPRRRGTRLLSPALSSARREPERAMESCFPCLGGAKKKRPPEKPQIPSSSGEVILLPPKVAPFLGLSSALCAAGSVISTP